ncbi:hypothetical protein AAFF_G00190680 [Aldrovandia affinis]|uniref:Uncharacterized protein n=1 Tax=Aldrovandia affinis TaxID=143900 RepID=A0AAD7RJB2_9TELE|nr:hypothetical protein AAFF_G00190680 [Aldrovandia affinis]
MGAAVLNKVTALSKRWHRASMPNLCRPPRPGCPRALSFHTGLSARELRGRLTDSAGEPVVWPSLDTVCKWKQSVTERILKGHRGRLNCFQVRLRSCGRV